jgi:alkylhydroperoxidase/carboxymuconolactone decarboxylase family protein YurZ
VDVRLKNLIQIGVVIGAGCIPCTKLLVEKAIESGCAKEEIEEVLSIVSSLQNSECFCRGVGQEVVDRMKKPLEVGREVLENWR